MQSFFWDTQYFKQYLSNIWSSVHEKVSNTEPELKESVAY